MRYVSTFSGVEAATLAWEPLGWEPVAFSEIDPFASAVLGYRFPNVPNLGDITEVNWIEFKADRGPVELLVGGSPCQSFSIAGNRTGLSGASGLMWEYVRAVQELLPEWIVWENVPGALSSARGEDFGCLLRALDECGYGLAWRVLDAQFFGVPQRRRRVFLVGRLGDREGPVRVLFEPEGLRWDFKTGKKAREAITGGATESAGDGGGCLSAGLGSYALSDATANASIDEELCGTILSHAGHEAPIVCKIRGGADTYTKHDGSVGTAGKGALLSENLAFTLAATQDSYLFDPGARGYVCRRLTPRECERLQGMPDDWTMVPYRGKPAEECPDGPRYKAIGNSMAVPVMRWIGERIETESKDEMVEEEA